MLANKLVCSFLRRTRNISRKTFDAFRRYASSSTAEPLAPGSEFGYPIDEPEWNSKNPSPKLMGLLKKPIRNPEHTCVALFPGQGSQFVGMGSELINLPKVSTLYECASDIVGYDVLKLCLEGPEDQLSSTVYCQMAIFVTSLAAVEKLRIERPNALNSFVAAAGFSIGEFSALVFAGAMRFEDGVKLVQERGRCMQLACNSTKSAMLVVKERYDSKLANALEAARAFARSSGIGDPVCQVANYLFTQCKTVAGHEQAIQFLQDNASEFGVIPVKRLKVSGAFHTPLMEEANFEFKKTLRQIPMQLPSIPVYCNMTGKKYPRNIERIRKQLGKQLVYPVKWEQSMADIYERSKEQPLFPRSYELGPGSSLTNMLKKINSKAAMSCSPIPV